MKRSAFQTEDHPLEYFTFEGTIPEGEYGGGTVMVWDVGTFDTIDGNYWKGDLKLWLSGKKLNGRVAYFSDQVGERQASVADPEGEGAGEGDHRRSRSGRRP